MSSGILLTELTEQYGLVYELSFHAEGFLAAAVGDGRVPVWETASWHLVSTLNHPSYVYSAVFYPKDSNMIATGGFDRVIRIWRREGGSSSRVIQELSGHNSHINCIAFDEDGHFLFSGDEHGYIKMWESPDTITSFGFESSTDSYARPGAGSREVDINVMFIR